MKLELIICGIAQQVTRGDRRGVLALLTLEARGDFSIHDDSGGRFVIGVPAKEAEDMREGDVFEFQFWRAKE